MDQLQDLEELKADLDEEERQEMAEETQAQLTDFEELLQEMTEGGSLSLHDEVSSMRRAILGAITQVCWLIMVLPMIWEKFMLSKGIIIVVFFLFLFDFLFDFSCCCFVPCSPAGI